VTAPASADRGQWSSQIGFILAAAGSAIGLGNIWRFPYSAGEGGGGAFVLIYLVCVLALGLPVMLLEISLGRRTQKNPVGAIRTIRPKGPWKALGYLAILTGLGILSFYAVIAGEVLEMWVDYSQRLVTGRAMLDGFGAAPSLGFFALFVVLTVLVVAGGVQRGIERWAKILMPVLLVMMLGIIVRGLMLPGASKGVAWLLTPDFSKITLKVVLDAMAQAFFSLSLGMGAMLTYGSYLSKKQNILHCAAWVVAFDTLIAILAGFMIFPALFALGQKPDAGPNLIFQVLPAMFDTMPGGTLVGAAFFFLLGVAALTSTVSLLEVVAAYFIDELDWTRRRTVWAAGAATIALGIPSALAWVGIEPLASGEILGQKGFFSLMDFLWVNLSLPFGALMLCLFAAYVWGLKPAVDEIVSSAPGFRRLAPVWRVFILVVCPIAITVILVTKLIPS
jgi:NSS family neurotransmitter:Na+ symporter